MKKVIIAAILAVSVSCNKSGVMCDCLVKAERQEANIWRVVSTSTKQVPSGGGDCSELNGYRDYQPGTITTIAGGTVRNGATRNHYNCE